MNVDIGAMSELDSGVDALYMSGHALLHRDFVETLSSAKAQASAFGDRVEIEIGNEHFVVARSGFHRSTYRLEHEHGLIGVSDSERLPTFWSRERSSLSA
jgi:hypothetical protein